MFIINITHLNLSNVGEKYNEIVNFIFIIVELI